MCRLVRPIAVMEKYRATVEWCLAGENGMKSNADLLRCHCVHHESHVKSSETKHGAAREETSAKPSAQLHRSYHFAFTELVFSLLSLFWRNWNIMRSPCLCVCVFPLTPERRNNGARRDVGARPRLDYTRNNCWTRFLLCCPDSIEYLVCVEREVGD
jgi:hypothetical protein